MRTPPLILTAEEFTVEAEVKPDLLTPLVERSAAFEEEHATPPVVLSEDLELLPEAARAAVPHAGVTLGTLIGFKDHGQVPLVLYSAQPGTAALRAVSVLALDGTHIGRNVVLSFENGMPDRPVILGLVRNEMGTALKTQCGQLSVEADGEKLLVTAQRQLVLRCGNASITLTKAGKVLITGTYVSQRSTGTLRIKGGSVQIN